MPGKHGLGAAGEFVRERFRDGGPKIIARLSHDAPSQIQRTITGGPFKFPHWLVNFLFHASNSISAGGTKAVHFLSYFSQPVLSIPRLPCGRRRACSVRGRQNARALFPG